MLSLPGAGHAATVEDLVRAYPEFLSGFDGSSLLWKDGTRMPLGELHPGLDTERPAREPSILDQLAPHYPAGMPILPPLDDPGRLRNQAFFDRMYGNCRAGEVTPKLVHIVWLPKTWGHSVTITSVNGVDRELAAVSRELDELPAQDAKFLFPLGGTYNCRDIAGTDRTSMHSWAAAIDINTSLSDYWRWARSSRDVPAYRNRIPPEIVAAFEHHGFIWGGRWSHFDTMHFEYRPEMIEREADDEAASGRFGSVSSNGTR